MGTKVSFIQGVLSRHKDFKVLHDDGEMLIIGLRGYDRVCRVESKNRRTLISIHDSTKQAMKFDGIPFSYGHGAQFMDVVDDIKAMLKDEAYPFRYIMKVDDVYRIARMFMHVPDCESVIVDVSIGLIVDLDKASFILEYTPRFAYLYDRQGNDIGYARNEIETVAYMISSWLEKNGRSCVAKHVNNILLEGVE